MDFGSMLVYFVSYFGLFTALFFLITLFEFRDELRNPQYNRLPSVTIIVPAYNEENTLAKTIDSLAKLDYPNELLEIVVVDDGSKDDTLKIAKNLESDKIRVFSKKNGGKGTALNFALARTDSELVGALDADSFVQPDALKKMVGYFEDSRIMAVTPSLKIYNPSTILQKIQRIEYLIGIFLRKVFAFLGSIHVTPGPFTIYRREFFQKYGGYDENNITEDIEIALRIQKNGYLIENSIDAYVFTVPPKNFRILLKQRLRWYMGFTENVLRYKQLFGPKYGNLGLFVLPASFISVFLVIITLFYSSYKIIDNIIQAYLNYEAVNFDISQLFKFNLDLFFFSANSLLILSIASLVTGLIVIYLAKRISGEEGTIKWNYAFYLLFYWFLFGFWWIIAFTYKLLGRRIDWGHKSIS